MSEQITPSKGRDEAAREGAPARGFRPRDTPRARAEAELVDELQRLTVESERVAHAFAGRHGLHPTDLQALLEVMRSEVAGEPLTAGELAVSLGITTGAVTGVVDRLERHGHLRRDRGGSDRRKVFLRYAEPGMAVARDFFGPLGRRSDEVMRGYGDEELVLVRRFLAQMADALAAHHDELRSPRA
ncbi:MarR family winged helix-turn-helix transcriptional regulator [Kineococcus sp. SYSU DK006]|uniref:MarR family winged helix-turn-helix transcriptional regulator n=1 Tax=Kineococcus sp. SYSU DK006 TaxID=3383127 RepID=UPI003D7DA61A